MAYTQKNTSFEQSKVVNNCQRDSKSKCFRSLKGITCPCSAGRRSDLQITSILRQTYHPNLGKYFFIFLFYRGFAQTHQNTIRKPFQNLFLFLTMSFMAFTSGSLFTLAQRKRKRQTGQEAVGWVGVNFLGGGLVGAHVPWQELLCQSIQSQTFFFLNFSSLLR